MHGHRVPDGREGQLRDDRRDGRGEAGRLSRVGGVRQLDTLDRRVVDGRGQSRRGGDHDAGDARVAGRGVRAHGGPGMGVGRGNGQVGRPDGHQPVRRHRQAVGHQESRKGHKGQ